ncbi:MAG: mobile mystery protein A [Burkholderiales bacterium]|nr:mobile mystery protein A [Burkholderiales bacterium]MCJ7837740.1 mobile mystery protein A [Burkholderiales bacterium]
MTEKSATLQRLQLTDALGEFPSSRSSPPGGGWVRAIREALGMTQAQLAARLDISRQSLQGLERAEANRRITLDSLDRLAKAMDCRLVYALVPEEGSLDDVRARRAQEVANEMLKSTEHSMKLEAQGVPGRESKRQRKLLVDSLLRGSPRKLWR